ncbi:hypothetical protein MHK_007435 [Candidatus Magnetomorum sp. HK-1]|nr:hypothetical protein MHK_007435 [Candidatus Magnetomorum sp. HK-1]
MIKFIEINLDELKDKGRDYPWKRPDNCSRCGNYKVWGHGFVESYFDGFKNPLILKRYRCPVCGCVICYRPITYFKRFQSPIQTIKDCISFRLNTGRWPIGLPKSRQGHWLRSLKKRVIAFLGNTWCNLIDAFDYLLKMGQIPVSRTI